MTRNGDLMNGSSPISPGNPFYLARDVLGPGLRYSLRQTYRDDNSDILNYREVFSFGQNPQDFIIYCDDDNSCAIDPRVMESVAHFVAADAEEMVEELLWPFVRPDIRGKREPFMRRGRYRPLSALTTAEHEAIAREIHIFDRRRLHYFWYGAIDQSALYKMPAKLCRRLLGKSRDEKEQYFIAAEQSLYADQVKEYLFTVFNLQQHFTESFARFMPQALSQDRLDTFFVDELCRLNDDGIFWQHMGHAKGLQPYLIRYLTMFFDFDFSANKAINDFIKQFKNSHRHFRFPKKKNSMSTEKAGEIFGEPVEKLSRLSNKELAKLYRSKAKILHPDKGGEHDEFVRLTEAFEQLLRQR